MVQVGDVACKAVVFLYKLVAQLLPPGPAAAFQHGAVTLFGLQGHGDGSAGEKIDVFLCGFF